MKLNSFILRACLLIFIISTNYSCDEIDTEEPGALVPETVEQDLSLPSISVNGTMLHTETFGNPNNSMVIFLHGGPGADYRNALNVKQLADNGYFVVFYDQRGAGLSKRHNKNSYSIQLLLEDLNAVINNYKTSPNQKIFLFGHSWGGILATAFINKYPTKIDGAILAEAGGLKWDDLKEYNKKSKKLEFFTEAANDALYLDQFFTGTENQHQILDYKLAIQSSFSYADDNTEGIEGPSPFWRYGAVTLNSLVDIAENDGYDFTTNLNQYQKKVLILYSENNKAYDLSVAQKEANYFPIHQIEKIDGTGHEMIYFKWNSVFPKVLSYLNSL
ncbi:alpha/beta hydrolase [Mariniflexile sp.]|uniref:alpha/beta hydrolase n=1 Tax=Mariniflexile sp. TaxID=1979402 RepID=UPI004048E873